MNNLKLEIYAMLETGGSKAQLENLISVYEKEYPKDLDLYFMNFSILVQDGDYGTAYQLAEKALQIYPFSMELHKWMRDICELCEKYPEALQHAQIMDYLQNKFGLPSPGENRIEQLVKAVEFQGAEIAKCNSREAQAYRENVAYVLKHQGNFYGLCNEVFRTHGNILGSYYEDMLGDKKYQARYNSREDEDWFLGERAVSYSPFNTKLDCREVTETKEFTVEGAVEVILPVLTQASGTVYEFILPGTGEKVFCKNKIFDYFNYYRLPPQTKIKSDETLYIGNPIPLTHNEKNKRLVLNIFLDGFAQKIIEEEGLENLMPHTAAFFRKGTVCSNCYATGEWTLPSLASYVTGVSTVRHHMFHNELSWYLPVDITLLQEYFKEQGYQTAKIDGEWRSTQAYGYGRGMDRVIYQVQHDDMRVEHVTANVLEHMELLRDTDQFIWMGIGDLHDIADGYELTHFVQSSIPLENRGVEEKGATSVKQGYSVNKRLAYIRQMKHIDKYLRLLYEDIEENYTNDEILVTMFGDHGQGYFVRDGEHFLETGRSKVGLLLRGGGVPAGAVCDEVMSICDYITVMCKLTGISMKDEGIDGQLPKFFGGKTGREYAITDSIHPGDLYHGAVFTADHRFFLTSEGKTKYDGRFELGDYEEYLLDADGNPCDNETEKKRLRTVLLEHIAEHRIY